MFSPKSEAAFAEAKKYIPGGVNSPVRAFASVGSNPLFIEKAEGSKIYDIDGREYIDFVGSWGPMLLGHAFPDVTEAIKVAAENSASFGAPTTAETETARLICEMAHIDKVRMVNSGTEATMSAIRLARGFTGRDLIIKFEGCYHGHSDSLLIKAGSGALTFGTASSAGVPADLARHTLVLPYNDFDALNGAFKKFGNEIAGIIIEPVAGNMGVVPPADGFLQEIRRLTSEYGAVFIVDEVMTGFRVSPSGACGLYGIEPDIVTFGKIIGGGLPVGAYGGRAEIMDFISPIGPVYQAGTLSGNPITMAAGRAQLSFIKKNPQIYDEIERHAARLEAGIKHAAEKAGIAVQVNRVASMLSVFFTDTPVTDFKTAVTSDTDMFRKYFLSMLESGIYLAPSQFESVFVGLAHSEEDIDKTISAAEKGMSLLAQNVSSL